MDVKYFHSLLSIMVCFAALFDGCVPSSSVEWGSAAAESLEETINSNSQHGDDSALDASSVGVVADDHQLKRAVSVGDVPDTGHETSDNRPYYTHRQIVRHNNRQQPYQQQYQQQQQQQQQLQHQPQPQQQHQPQPQPQQYSHNKHQQMQSSTAQRHMHQYRGPVADRFLFGPSSSNIGGGYNNENSDSFYQIGGGGGSGGGGGETISFESTGFADFVPTSGFRGPTVPPAVIPSQPSPPYPATHGQLQSSSFDGGSSGQLFDHPTGFGQEPSHGGGGYDYSPPQHQAPIIHKSIYVHVAPPDDEPPRKQRVIYPSAPPKKNYQIVFIKAPVAPPLVAPIIPPPQQTADKTLIYVLHPKPEEAPPIHIPPPPVTQPLKPEVYFIKYKHREDPPVHGGGDYGHGGGDYGSGGAGGSLPSPGEEFGSGGDTSGYVHRRYGRGGGDPASVTSTGPPQGSTTGDDAATAAKGAEPEDDDDDVANADVVNGMASRPADPTVAATARETGSAEPLSGGYSAEYSDDASVDSTNLSETAVVPSNYASKGKNGH